MKKKKQMAGLIMAGLLMQIMVLSGCSNPFQESKIARMNREGRTTNVEDSILKEREAETVANGEDSQEEQEQEDDQEDARILIAYFTRADNVKSGLSLDASTSASIRVDEDGELYGNVSMLADDIQNLTHGTVFQIKTSILYSQDYNTNIREGREELDAGTMPVLYTFVTDMQDYDVIFLGFPNWWGTIPMPVASFLTGYDFSGKTILPFCSHDGSGMGNSLADIRRYCPDSTVKTGLAIKNADTDSDYTLERITDWVDASGIAY